MYRLSSCVEVGLKMGVELRIVFVYVKSAALGLGQNGLKMEYKAAPKDLGRRDAVFAKTSKAECLSIQRETLGTQSHNIHKPLDIVQGYWFDQILIHTAGESLSLHLRGSDACHSHDNGWTE